MLVTEPVAGCLRPFLRRGVRFAERPVLAAFVALVGRQARRGPVTRAAEEAIAAALHQVPMTLEGAARRRSPVVREVSDQFHRLYYDDIRTWRRNRWQGHKTWKSPNDLWLYAEIIHRIKPGLIVETGTAFGGSATYLGFLLDIEGHGEVVSVDIDPRGTPEHPRVTYLTGSSVDPAIVAKVKGMVAPGEPVLVILDSDHREPHVYAELMAYADLVPVGSYVIVEDSNVNGHPVVPEHGPGPMEALLRFVAQRPDFVIDRSMHRMHLTLNPNGYLKRIEA